MDRQRMGDGRARDRVCVRVVEREREDKECEHRVGWVWAQ